MTGARNTLAFEPADPREHTWDVIVIGCGMGGSALGYSLARQGRRVLFLEKGYYLFGDHKREGGLIEPSDPEERLRQGRWPVRLNGHVDRHAIDMFPAMGCGTGGSTSLFAAQLERMHPADFVPALHHGPLLKASNAPSVWPFAYDELLPYYRVAESLFEVCGTPDPYNPDPLQRLRLPPPLSDRDTALMQYLSGSGFSPYHAHVGCRYVPDCAGCGGVLCPKDCKSDAGRVCLRPAVCDHGAKLVTRAEVTRLEVTGSRVDRVHYRKDGQEHWVRGNTVVLAAGAMITPALLLQSACEASPDGVGNRSGQVGRNLMMHAGDYVALQLPADLDPRGPEKALSFNDLYFDEGVKLGTTQSVGMPINAGVIEYFLKARSERTTGWMRVFGAVVRKVAARVGARMFRSASVFSTIIEDLPYLCNRVVLDKSNPNGMRFEYTYPHELLLRSERMRAVLRRRLPSDVGMMVLSGDQNLNFGHVSGTCRIGEDASMSVADGSQRFHDVENLYVADASAFPTSGGINPSLTIAATALRVADIIHARLPGQTAVTREKPSLLTKAPAGISGAVASP